MSINIKAGLTNFINNAGWARIIIGIFLISLYVAAPFVQVSVATSISDTIVRFAMNGIMVLAMVPMIRSGCGLNFGLPLGIIAGILGALISLELNLNGLPGIFTAMIIGLSLGAVLGIAYGVLLNTVKGDEMMIATYVGFSAVFFMGMAWLVLPFTSPVMIWGFGGEGEGLRTTISVGGHWHRVISDIGNIRVVADTAAQTTDVLFNVPSAAIATGVDSTVVELFYLPTGMIIFFFMVAFIVWLFFETKTGLAMSSVGQNADFARASGLNVNRQRMLSVMISTMLGALGIIVYQQSFGFIQLYNAPLYMAFPAVASVLLGGASINRVTITNVVVGTFLFQGILTMTPSVINSALQMDISEVIRLVVSNGMILYALTRRRKETR